MCVVMGICNNIGLHTYDKELVPENLLSIQSYKS